MHERVIVDDKYFQSHFSNEFNQSVCGACSIAPSGPWSHPLIISLRVLQLPRHEDRYPVEYTSDERRGRVTIESRGYFLSIFETCRSLPSPCGGDTRAAGSRRNLDNCCLRVGDRTVDPLARIQQNQPTAGRHVVQPHITTSPRAAVFNRVRFNYGRLPVRTTIARGDETSLFVQSDPAQTAWSCAQLWKKVRCFSTTPPRGSRPYDTRDFGLVRGTAGLTYDMAQPTSYQPEGGIGPCRRTRKLVGTACDAADASAARGHHRSGRHTVCSTAAIWGAEPGPTARVRPGFGSLLSAKNPGVSSSANWTHSTACNLFFFGALWSLMVTFRSSPLYWMLRTVRGLRRSRPRL